MKRRPLHRVIISSANDDHDNVLVVDAKTGTGQFGIPPAVSPPGFEWFNIWSRMDIISGQLNYYDNPALPPNQRPCVINQRDPKARIPLVAHVQYWTNPLLRRQLYRFVTA